MAIGERDIRGMLREDYVCRALCQVVNGVLVPPAGMLVEYIDDSPDACVHDFWTETTEPFTPLNTETMRWYRLAPAVRVQRPRFSVFRPKITEAIRAEWLTKYKMLREAVTADKLAMILTMRKTDARPVAVLCVMQQSVGDVLSGVGELSMAPVAALLLAADVDDIETPPSVDDTDT